MAELQPRFGKVGSEIKESTSAIKPKFGKPGTEISKRNGVIAENGQPTGEIGLPLDMFKKVPKDNGVPTDGTPERLTYSADDPRYVPEGVPNPAYSEPLVEKAPDQKEKVPYTWEYGTGDKVRSLPSPIPGLGSQWLYEDLSGGVANSAKWMAETAGTFADKVLPGAVPRNWGEGIPTYESPDIGSPGSDLAVMTGEILGGIIAGNKVGGAAKFLQLVKNAPKALSAAKGIGSTIGGASSIDPHTQMAVVGEDSMIPLLEKLAYDESGNPDDDLLAKRLNFIYDATVAGGLVSGATKGAAGFGKLFWTYLGRPAATAALPAKVSKWIGIDRVESIENTVGQDVVRTAAGLKHGDTPEVVKKKLTTMIDRIKKGTGFSAKTGREDIPGAEFKRDTMTALERGIEEEGLTLETREMLANARGLRSGMANKSSGKLEATMDQSAVAAEQHFGDIDKAFGGEAAAKETVEALQDQAAVKYGTEINRTNLAKANISRADKDMNKIIESDPELAERFRRGQGVQLDATSGQLDAANDMLGKFDEASQVMTEEKNAYYAAMPDNAPTNSKILEPYIAKIQEILSPAGKKSLDKILSAEGGPKFKALSTWVDNDLQNEIGIALKDGRVADVRNLRELKHHVWKDQLEWLAAGRNPQGRFVNAAEKAEYEQTTAAATKARDYFRDTYAPFWRQGSLEEIQDITRTYRNKPADYGPKGRQQIMSTLDDPNQRENTELFAKLLKSDKGGSSAQPMMDYFLATISKKATPWLNASKNGTLTEEQIIELSGMFDSYIPLLKGVDEKQIARYEKFFTDLRAKKFTKAEWETQFAELEAKLPEVKKKIFGKDYKEFFKEGDPLKPRSNITDVYDDMFDNAETNADLPKIIAKALSAGNNGEPDKIAGLRAAYGRYLDRKFLKGSVNTELAGGQKARPITDEEVKRVYEAGDQLFRDQPEVMAATRLIVDEFRKTRSGSNKQFPAFDLSTFRKEGGKTTDTMITILWGTLNKWAAKARSATGRVLASGDPSNLAFEVLEKIYADPDYFVEISRRLVAKNGQVDKSASRLFHKFLGLEAIYADDERTKSGLERETEKAFGNEPIDFTRPVITNPDGSISTEETITIQDDDGSWINIPSIVDGKRRSEDEAIQLMRQGKNKPVGRFKTLEEAETEAVKRSEEIGLKRRPTDRR